jgi:KaiC/GvpD/RAD55 family RecA-like ATPase
MKKGDTILISNSGWSKVKDIKVPDKLFEPLKLEIKDLDSLLSELGGIIPSQCIFFTGTPGVGKTTLAMFILSKLADQVGKTFAPVIKEGHIMKRTVPERFPAIISLEMSDFQLKAQTRKIPGLDHILIKSEMKDIDETIEELKKLQPSLVAIDSVQKWAEEKPTKMIECVKKFYKFSKDTMIPTILVGHCNKDGSFNGPQFLLREVDTHIHIKKDDIGEAWIELNKTRFGAVANPIPWEIKEFGLKIGYQVYTASGVKTDDQIMDEIAKKSGEIVPSIARFKEGEWDEEKMKEGLQDLFIYLKNKYRKELQHGGMTNPDKMFLQFKDVNHTCARVDHIQIGLRMVRRWMPGTKSIYRGEDSYIKKWCKTQQDVTIWLFIHEFAHMFKNMRHHKHSFFQHVHKIATGEAWLFHSSKK